MRRTGVATSGIGRRAWLDARGRPAHHLLDPSTGRPAYTGIVQVTALAPSALMAEIRAKAAILSGPRAGGGWLPDGGVIVLDDGSHEVIEPATPAPASRPSADERPGDGRARDARPDAEGDDEAHRQLIGTLVRTGKWGIEMSTWSTSAGGAPNVTEKAPARPGEMK